MGNISNTREKNIVGYNSAFIEKSDSLINDKALIYCTVQDLYDMTSLKNGFNIDLVAELIYKSKKVKMVMDSRENIKNSIVDFYSSLKLLGLNTDLYDCKEKLNLEEKDLLLIIGDDMKNKKYHEIFDKCLMKNLKIIKILSERNKMCENEIGISLYYLDCNKFDKLMCMETLLKCIYLGVLAKFDVNCEKI